MPLLTELAQQERGGVFGVGHAAAIAQPGTVRARRVILGALANAQVVAVIPIVIGDACGFGHQEAAERSLAALRFAGDAIITDASMFCALLRARG